MAGWYLDSKMAQDIVTRTMAILETNINLMDAGGRIIGSGDAQRIGERHEGALLALARGEVVEIDAASAGRLYGVREGINLPLRVEGKIVGAIGLSGDPQALRKYGELVCMNAEMMLEQSRLMHLLAQDNRLREELVLHLIQAEESGAAQFEWAQRLGIDLSLPRVAAVVEVDSGQGGTESVLAELQRLQHLLAGPQRDNLIAGVSLHEIVVLIPALNHAGCWDAELHRSRIGQLMQRMAESSPLCFRIALGHYFPGKGSIARSYRSARTTMKIGKRRMPDSRGYFYQQLQLPVLLESLRDGWQADELNNLLIALKQADGNGQLRRTLNCWFHNNAQSLATAKALFIHRNTLDYRLQRAAGLCGLNLGRFDDRLLLYIALQLDDGGE